MAKVDLIRNLEKISFMIPNRLLKVEGYLLREDSEEFLEIIIYRGFSSSTTHQIEIDSEKQVIKLNYFLTNLILCRAPLTKGLEEIIKETKNPHFFLNQKNWT